MESFTWGSQTAMGSNLHSVKRLPVEILMCVCEVSLSAVVCVVLIASVSSSVNASILSTHMTCRRTVYFVGHKKCKFEGNRLRQNVIVFDI